MNSVDRIEFARLNMRVRYLEEKNKNIVQQGKKADALAVALGYQFITVDTGEMFVFNSTIRAIKKELLEDTND